MAYVACIRQGRVREPKPGEGSFVDTQSLPPRRLVWSPRPKGHKMMGNALMKIANDLWCDRECVSWKERLCYPL